MDLSKNTIKVESSSSVEGCVLNKRVLKSWIYRHGYNQYIIARVMGLRLRKFKNKLRYGKIFNRKEITKLVHFVHAKAAIKMIVFASGKQEKTVKRAVFGLYENRRHRRNSNCEYFKNKKNRVRYKK